MLQLISDKKKTLKEFTENRYAQASFYWTTLMKNKEIRVNGKRVDKDVFLQEGDVVSYFLTKKQEEKPAFHVVYEDERVLVVDKESGVNSEAVFSALQRVRPCYFIHRLDRNTKGLLIFSLDERAESSLLSAFKERRVEKKYHALCFGALEKSEVVLTAYLKKEGGKSLVRVFDKKVNGAETIITEYKVLERMGDKMLVEVTLHTGKTHQIRAHLAHVGCPIVGDMKYGFTAKNKENNVARQCLVSKKFRLSLEGELSYLNEKEFISRFEAELPIK